jgi:acyl carrier protein
MNGPIVSYGSREAFAAALCDFINHELPRLHSRLAVSPGVAPDTALFASGLIDSLAVLHLVAWVESALGRTLSLEEVVMSRFQTANAIAASFWQPPAA